MRATGRQGSVQRDRRPIKTIALTVSLLVGARLMAAAIGSPGHAWLAWFSLVPLFLVIQLCRPPGVMLAGALWGVCLLAFSASRPEGVISPTVRSLLLAAVPVAYAGAAAWLTRLIGFSPFCLGIGWMGVESAFGPVGLRTGLPAATQGHGTLMHCLAGALAFVAVGLLVPVVNAWLASALNAGRLKIPQLRPQIASDDAGARLVPQTFLRYSPFAIHSIRPRGPPTSDRYR